MTDHRGDHAAGGTAPHPADGTAPHPAGGDPRLIPCRDAVRQLWDFLDGAVPPTDHAQIEEHLAFCRRCCGEVEFVAHLRGLLASQSADERDPQTVQRLDRFIEEL